MICPACKKDMIVVEYKNVELDYCINCHGVWFDSEELELLLKSMNLDTPDLLLTSILNSTEVKVSEKKRKCPICRQKMKKATITGQPEILVDVCQQKDGLWFDGGEVHQLLKQLAEKQPVGQGPQQQIISFMGEVFQAQA